MARTSGRCQHEAPGALQQTQLFVPHSGSPSEAAPLPYLEQPVSMGTQIWAKHHASAAGLQLDAGQLRHGVSNELPAWGRVRRDGVVQKAMAVPQHCE